MWCQVQATSAVTGRGCPLVRSKHAMCVTSDGHIYLYGGRSMANQALRDLWRFDTGQNQWEEVFSRNECHDHPNNHQNHHHSHHPNYSNAYLSHYRQSGVDTRHSHHPSSSLSSRSSSSNSSSAATSPPSSPYDNQQQEPPPPLQEHTIIAAKNKLYIFGGEVGYSSDETPLWIFDLTTVCWHKLTSKSSTTSPTCAATSPSSQYATSRPLGRRGHTAVCYKNLMCIYGGYQDLKGSSSELWTFDLDHEEWSLEGNSHKKSANPAPRHAHSAVVYKESMYIYGGMTDLQIRNDFWSWNFRSKEWHRIKAVRNPSELSGHSAIVVLDSMFVYGGESGNGNSKKELWRFRFTTQQWENIVIEGIAPGNRTRHVALSNPFLNYFGTNSFVEWNGTTTAPRKLSARLFSGNRNKKKTKHKKHCKLTMDDYETSFISGAITDTEDVKSNEDEDEEENGKETGANQIEPKKSISLCFDSLDDANSSILSPEDERNLDKIKIRTNHSFRMERSGIDCIEPQCKQTLSDDENDDEFVELDEFNRRSTIGTYHNSRLNQQNQQNQKQQQPNYAYKNQTTKDISNIENDKNMKNIEANRNTASANQVASSNTDNSNSGLSSNSNNNNNNNNNEVVVRMRPRRPILQKQRPYSDFYATINNGNSCHNPKYRNQGLAFDAEVAIVDDHSIQQQQQTNEKQYKRRSVQESMSYYSLCFATPPASLKLTNRSPTSQMVPPMSPLIEPSVVESSVGSHHKVSSSLNSDLSQSNQQQQCSTNAIASRHQDEPEPSELNDTPDQEVIVRRRENSSIKRRMRRANLELRELNSSMMLSSTESSNFNSAYYSLSLDISPDFEKELKCGTALSTPSNQQSNNPNDRKESMENFDHSSSYDHDENMRGGHIDLDLLEDYLEPEEMLEIVTESTNDDEVSPTVNIKTIQKTPGRAKGKLERNQGFSNHKSRNQPGHHSSSTASVSHSSSGYQSLVLGDGNGAGSFDLMSDPSLSNSSSFARENQHDEPNNEREFVQNLHRSLARSIDNHHNTNTGSKQTQKSQRVKTNGDSIELRQMRLPLNLVCQQLQQKPATVGQPPQTKPRSRKDSVVVGMGQNCRSRSLDRALENRQSRSGGQNSHHHYHRAHWEPNIKEVIREIIVPGSPALSKFGQFDSNNPDNDCPTSPATTVGTDTLIDRIYGESGGTKSSKKSSFISIRGRSKSRKNASNADKRNQMHNGVKRHWQLCMYVFGGKEQGANGVLHKQPITIWKLYI